MPKLPTKLDFQGYLTLAYIGAVAVGMMFDFQYYTRFSINIFEYADILDFLLAPFRNLEVIVFVTATLTFLWLLFSLDKFWEKRHPKSYNRFIFIPWQKKARPFVFAFSVVIYLFLAAEKYGERKYDQFLASPEEVSLTFEGGSKTLSGSMIGKNKDYLFIQTPDSLIRAIPVNADVQEIIVAKASPKEN